MAVRSLRVVVEVNDRFLFPVNPVFELHEESCGCSVLGIEDEAQLGVRILDPVRVRTVMHTMSLLERCQTVGS